MSYITGSVGIGNAAAVLAQSQSDSGEPLDEWRLGVWSDGEWRVELEIEFRPVSIVSCDGKGECWTVLGANGEALWLTDVLNKGSTRTDQVAADEYNFTAIQAYAGGIAATQMSRRVYWTNGGVWTQLGEGLVVEAPGELLGFESLTALDDELYASGWRGEIWYLEGGRWRQAASPTNMILSGSAATASDVIVCGRLGTILRGRRGRWDLINHQQAEEDFWSAAVFRGRIYLSSMGGIYELDGQRLLHVDDDTEDATYYHLSANDRLLLSVGSDSVLAYDGSRWSRLI